MAIQKESASTLRKCGGTYVVLPSESMQLIKDPVSLAVWAYLLNKPDNWIVRNAEIQDRFGIGRDRTTQALGHLRDIGLVWDEYSRDASGRVLGRNLVCSSKPNNAFTEQRISRNTAEPYDGKHVALSNNRSLTQEQIDTKGQIKDLLPSKLDDDVKAAIEYLNSVTGSKYRASTKSHSANIKARLNDGHSVDDLISVIKFKSGEWLTDPRMAQYLRPETLFQAGKFNGYLTAARSAESPVAALSAISRRNAENLKGEW